MSPFLVPPISPGTPPPGIFPNIGPPTLCDGTTSTPGIGLYLKLIPPSRGIPVPSSGAIPLVQMRSAQQGRFLGPVFSNFMVQTPSSPHNRNYLPKCFLTDFLPTMYGTYTPNLGPFGAGPDLVMHLPISDFSENCEPLVRTPSTVLDSNSFLQATSRYNPST